MLRKVSNSQSSNSVRPDLLPFTASLRSGRIEWGAGDGTTLNLFLFRTDYTLKNFYENTTRDTWEHLHNIHVNILTDSQPEHENQLIRQLSRFDARKLVSFDMSHNLSLQISLSLPRISIPPIFHPQMARSSLDFASTRTTNNMTCEYFCNLTDVCSSQYTPIYSNENR